MLWKDGRRSDNIEDRRGEGSRLGGRGAVGGIGTLVLVLVALYFGVDPGTVLNQVAQQPVRQTPTALSQEDAKERDFLAVVLADTEDTWTQVFRASGRTYTMPKLVLFSGSVRSACGYAQAAMGPFYCPNDRKLYLDTAFFHQMAQQYHAPGDFAQAYVVAHEVGHHVQNLLGTLGRVHEAQQAGGESRANALQVRVELQADCYAGLWAYHAEHARHILEVGDVDEALRAAAAVGDDRLQQQARGYVVPDSFTHGSSAQRAAWFRAGYTSGDPARCNTFAMRRLD